MSDMLPLPEPNDVTYVGTQLRRAFIAEQMHAYARAFAEQETKELRQELDMMMLKMLGAEQTAEELRLVIADLRAEIERRDKAESLLAKMRPTPDALVEELRTELNTVRLGASTLLKFNEELVNEWTELRAVAERLKLQVRQADERGDDAMRRAHDAEADRDTLRIRLETAQVELAAVKERAAPMGFNRAIYEKP